ncbi:transmembrane protein, putative (macronuclear) [Tetrahymena thermophila SB210]|uniref:Transmembrane protein, putative n=1 Tax=Tetrahymena thermophila (strain SB210) TaxID=312017 RepID=I7M4C1_TETTS|nr:transmembrane protein, putative [Tetrahymena thermophila SB210]EAS06198.1 transmembrane protein, putative [Tetrahymena thermophila SB210]|eukprot:XP_001026443.1 transmembrane protein, putative [Tetrahymena thermophila SB210]
MKLIGIPIFLSVLLLLSASAYLVIHKNSSILINLESGFEYSSCLNIEIVQVGHAYPTYDLYALNICEKPKRFTLVYSFAGNPPKTFVSQCLEQNQKEDTPLIYQFSVVTKSSQEDC